MGSIIENLRELKNHLKETASIHINHLRDATSTKMEYFNQKLHDVYDALSSKITAVEAEAKDKNDQARVALLKQYEDLKIAFNNYKTAGSEKVEKAHEAIVDKLHQLNEKIDEYNKNKKG